LREDIALRFLVLFLALFIAPRNLQAYIDPGAGSLAVQALIAFIGAVVAFWGRIVSGVKGVLSRFKKR
jgi:hypothetical protein